MGIMKILVGFIAILLATSAVILIFPGIPPDVNFEAFDIPDPIKLEGWFATNTVLDEAELYYESTADAVIESVAVWNDDEIYTGDSTGSILKITGKQVAETVAKLEYPCGHDSNLLNDGKRQTCRGGPLGMRFDKKGRLLIADLFGGLTRVNVKTGEYENIVSKSQPIEGKLPLVPDDLEEGEDGSIYWTDGSTTGNFFEEALAQPSGRLIKFDPKTRRNEVLLEKLHFSNGVCLSDNNDFVLVAETVSPRIKRYYLQGSKKGQSDTFVERLPGYPDNIRSNGRGGFYVPIIIPWNDQFSMRIHTISARPTLRKLILRSRHILLKLIAEIKRYLPDNIYVAMLEKYVDHIEHVTNIGNVPKTAMVVELSKTGEIIGVLHGKSGKVTTPSHISVGKKFAFIVSPIEQKIWRIKLDALRKIN